ALLRGRVFWRRLSWVSKSLGEAGLGRVTPEGTYNDRPFIDALQANGPFNPSLTTGGATCAPLATHPTRRGHFTRHWGASVLPDPTPRDAGRCPGVRPHYLGPRTLAAYCAS